MGGEKAGALLAGRPLISYPVAALRAAGLDPFVVTKADRPVDGLPGIDDVEVVVEPDEPRHPLLGVLTALRRAGRRPVIVTGCDLPLLPPEYLRWLATRPGGTVLPRVEGRLQPLAARYGPDAASEVEHGVRTEAPMKAVIAGLSATVVAEEDLRRFGDPSRTFANVNTPKDLVAIERILTAADPGPRG